MGRRDPLHDPRPGDVVDIGDGYAVRIATRTPRKVHVELLGDDDEVLDVLVRGLGEWRRVCRSVGAAVVERGEP